MAMYDSDGKRAADTEARMLKLWSRSAFMAGQQRGASLGRKNDPISGETPDQAFELWWSRSDQ